MFVLHFFKVALGFYFIFISICGISSYFLIKDIWSLSFLYLTISPDSIKYITFTITGNGTATTAYISK